MNRVSHVSGFAAAVLLALCSRAEGQQLNVPALPPPTVVLPTPASSSSPSQSLADFEASPARFTERITLPTTARLGMGYSTLSNELGGLSVVTGANTSQSQENEVRYDFNYIGSYRELARSLRIKASASLKGMTGSASASVELFRSAKISSDRAYVLVKMTVVSGVDSLATYNLTDAALQRLKNSPAEFDRAYGDAFIYSIAKGGELYALMEFQKSSEESAETLKARISGKLPGFVAKGEVEQKIKELVESREVSVKYSQTGGGTGSPIAAAASGPDLTGSTTTGGVLVMTPNELIQRIRVFPQEVRKDPTTAKPLFGDVMGYAAVDNLPSDARLAFTAKARWALEDMAQLKLDIDSELDNLLLARSAPARFTKETQELATPERIAYFRYLQSALERIAEVIVNNPGELEKIAEKSTIDPIDAYLAKVSKSKTQPKPAKQQFCRIAGADPGVARQCLLKGYQPVPLVDPLESTKVSALRLWENRICRFNYGTPDFTVVWGHRLGSAMVPPDVMDAARQQCRKITNDPKRLRTIVTNSETAFQCGVFWDVVCLYGE